jgi:HAD superfamily hydrolase (TIGR01509 family)
VSKTAELAAVIFDMDGVIVNSEPCHERAFAEVVKELGFERYGVRFSDYIGRSDHEMWTEFLTKFKPPHCYEELLRMKQRKVVEILKREAPLFDGLPELVEKLSARYKLALASGSERPVVETVLEFEGLKRFFPVTVTDSEVRPGKPAPDIFLRAAALLGVDPKACCVIEDSKPGIRAGLAAGMTVIAITNTYPAEELRAAHRVVSKYSEIAELLLGSG